MPKQVIMADKVSPLPQQKYDRLAAQHAQWYGKEVQTLEGEEEPDADDVSGVKTEALTIEVGQGETHSITQCHPALRSKLTELIINESNTPQIPGYVTFQFDAGANTPVLQSADLLQIAQITGKRGHVGGIDPSSKMQANEGSARAAAVEIELSNGAVLPLHVQGMASSSMRRNILPPQYLKEHYDGEDCLGESKHRLLSQCIEFNQGLWPSLVYNKLYFGFARLPSEDAVHNEINSLETVSAPVWAARLNLGSEALRSMTKSVNGMHMQKMSSAEADRIDNDRIRRQQVAKAKPMLEQRQPKTRHYDKGAVWVIDGFTYSGKDVVKQLDGSIGMLHGWEDSGTDYGYGRNVSGFTSEAHVDFMVHIFASEKKLGHTVVKFKLDAAPYIDTDYVKQQVESKTLAVSSRSHQAASIRAFIEQRRTWTPSPARRRLCCNEPRRTSRARTRDAINASPESTRCTLPTRSPHVPTNRHASIATRAWCQTSTIVQA